ncbi:hypothetical protein RJ639_019175, partial [Escallonia herrerae]
FSSAVATFQDESTLIWYYGKEEKQLELRHVSRIIPDSVLHELLPGLRDAIFQRYPRPEKEYQSFSLIYNDRSLDLICKDKDEAEIWFVGLKALIARSSYRKVRSESRCESVSSDSPHGRRVAPTAYFDQGDNPVAEGIPQSRLGKAFADIVTYTAVAKSYSQAEAATYSLSSLSPVCVDNTNGRSSAADTVRVSLSSAVSSSSQGSCHEEFDALGDIFIWGEGTGDGVLGGGVLRVGRSSSDKRDAYLPKALESTMVLDVHSIACGSRHAVLVSKQGEVFSWGEDSGGRLGHGIGADVSHPKLIDTLSGMNIEMVACGEYHTCAVTLSGDLYTWGDGAYNTGMLGHGSEVSHWIPKKIIGFMEGIHVSFVSCGPWHTAFITSLGQLFTFGDGTFGALGHGNHSSLSIPREVDALKEMRTVRVACGVWHTAAVVEVPNKSSDSGPSDGSSLKNLFTWGDGDKGRLGHCDKENRLFPECVAALIDTSFSQVACGHNLTIGLTTTGRVYTMGTPDYGQLGSPLADGKIPNCIEGKIADISVEEIACGSHHAAVLTSKKEVYTWGKGANGQLGHGDNEDRHIPTLVDFLKDKQVKSVVCGSNFTAVICLHRWVSTADNSVCSSCHNPFNFRRKRHNCYNCGLVFCKACSTRKSLKASLAPSTSKPYRVCDDCFTKLQKAMDSGSVGRVSRVRSGNMLYRSSDLAEKEAGGRFQGQFSRLSSADSLNLPEGRSSTLNGKTDTNDGRLFPNVNGNMQRGSFSWSKPPTAMSGSSKHVHSASAPNSRMISRAISPVSAKSSPALSATLTPTRTLSTSELAIYDPKHNNESLSQEIVNLKAQVEDLASKSQLLEAELERKSRELKEATALAEDEAAKCKAAKEVIKSLTVQSQPEKFEAASRLPAMEVFGLGFVGGEGGRRRLEVVAVPMFRQLKEMAERVPEGHSPSNKIDSDAEQICNDPSRHSNGSSVTSLTSPKSESNENSSNQTLVNGNKARNEKAEWVVQDEPGVYVTLSSLPGGGHELRRVRFSRKRFTEQQAEKWWAENGPKVCERHKIRTMD